MSLDKYYKILGLTPNASQDEVRRAYRKLVMVYHPDRNKHPKAEARFILIKEAYEIVTGKIPAPQAQRINRAQSRRPQTSPQETKEHAKRREEERLKEARKRYQEQKLKEYLENEMYFRRLTTGVKWKTIRVLAVIGGLIAFSMLLDRFLPHHYESDRVTHYNLNEASSLSGVAVSIIKTKKDNYYWVGNADYMLYSEAPDIFVESSWILHDPIHVISRGKTKNKSYDLYYTFYRNYFIVICFLAPIITMLFKRKTPIFTFVYLFSYYFTGILVIYHLFTNDRWAHLITLGFF